MDKVLLAFGLIVAVTLVLTGGFGIVQRGGSSGFGGFDLFSTGPKASGPGGSILQQPGEPSPAIIKNPVQAAAIDSKKVSIPLPGESVYKGLVKISSISRPSTDSKKPDVEYVLIYNARYDDKEPITITGWSLENTEGKRYFIGNAAKIPFGDAFESTASLESGAQAFIHTGRSPISISFRENSCTGYLNENRNFTPSLGGGCPYVDTSKFIQFNDSCLSYMQSVAGSCRAAVIAGDASVGIGDACSDYIVKHFNYSGCIADYKSTKDFYRNTWHFYLNRTEKLWRGLHDIITLRDFKGLVVDTYQY